MSNNQCLQFSQEVADGKGVIDLLLRELKSNNYNIEGVKRVAINRDYLKLSTMIVKEIYRYWRGH